MRTTWADDGLNIVILVSYLTSPSLLPHLSGALFWAAAAISSAMSAMSSERIARLPHRSGEESLRLRTAAAAASASDTERLPHLIMDERYQLPVRTRTLRKGRGKKFPSSTVLKVSCGVGVWRRFMNCCEALSIQEKLECYLESTRA